MNLMLEFIDKMVQPRAFRVAVQEGPDEGVAMDFTAVDTLDAIDQASFYGKPLTAWELTP